MENNHQSIALTASEISDLWLSYQADTLNICGLDFFLTHIEDQDIRHVLEQNLTLTKKRKDKEIEFFNGENYPVPHGFSDKDVNLNAPRLFSDRIYLEYLLNITNLELISFGSALAMAVRTDVIDFYSENLRDTQDLHKQVKELAKEKGIYIRPPNIPIPNQIDFVKKESFLAGWFGDRRPLLGVEIANLTYNSKRNALGQAVITAFSQVAESKEARQYFEKGREISGKHQKIFSHILHENYLSDGILLTSDVTDATVSPFSDRLMMNFVITLIAAGVGQYGAAMAESPRHDLSVMYTRLMAEIGKYANDGANILIENGWMEQPPIAADRKDLAKR